MLARRTRNGKSKHIHERVKARCATAVTPCGAILFQFLCSDGSACRSVGATGLRRFQSLHFFCGETSAFMALENSYMTRIIGPVRDLSGMKLKRYATLAANIIRAEWSHAFLP